MSIGATESALPFPATLHEVSARISNPETLGLTQTTTLIREDVSARAPIGSSLGSLNETNPGGDYGWVASDDD